LKESIVGTLLGPCGVTKSVVSRTCQERQAIEGDSPVDESEMASVDRPPEYHVEGLSCGKPGGPPSKAKYSWRPIVNEYREGKVKSTPEGE
jgi:hypothetical protein